MNMFENSNKYTVKIISPKYPKVIFSEYGMINRLFMYIIVL